MCGNAARPSRKPALYFPVVVSISAIAEAANGPRHCLGWTIARTRGTLLRCSFRVLRRVAESHLWRDGELQWAARHWLAPWRAVRSTQTSAIGERETDRISPRRQELRKVEEGLELAGEGGGHAAPLLEHLVA